METLRKPLQGLLNIVRFNWHFYVLSLAAILLLCTVSGCMPASLSRYAFLLAIAIFFPILLSLLTSLYVYDLSGLYKLEWLTLPSRVGTLVNVNAGFDETSALIAARYQPETLIALDFYHPDQHTEISLKRARKAYPAFPDTQAISTDYIPLENASVEVICLIFAAHEIRDTVERITFFQELHRILKPGGQLIVTEHLRDFPNFLAYNIGCLHFHAKRTWLNTFEKSGLRLLEETKFTPFISIFTLEKHGNTP